MLTSSFFGAMTLLSFLSAMTLLTLVAGHGGSFVDTANCISSSPPPFHSYHIHLIFWPDLEPGYEAMANSRNSTGALAVQRRLVEQFHIDLGANCTTCQLFGNCTDVYEKTRLCMFTFDGRVGWGINTPFLAPNWAAYVPVERFADTVSWIMQHRGVYDVFVHPNSGCFIEDILDWSMWGGSKWQLALPSDRGPLGAHLV